MPPFIEARRRFSVRGMDLPHDTMPARAPSRGRGARWRKLPGTSPSVAWLSGQMA